MLGLRISWIAQKLKAVKFTNCPQKFWGYISYQLNKPPQNVLRQEERLRYEFERP
jgi:hypothetical protein